MKGRTKDTIKVSAIVIISIIIATIITTLVTGRVSTEEIIIVNKEGLNVNLPLDEQLEYFDTTSISKTEFNQFNNSIVTDLSQIVGKRVNFELAVGSPIPLTALVEPNTGGQYAASLNQGMTVHMLPEATAGLPPIERGDKININLTYRAADNSSSEGLIRTSNLLSDVTVANVIEPNIYVEVTLEEDLILKTAAQMGSFSYQLPGQLNTNNCKEDEDCEVNLIEVKEAKQEFILDMLRKGESLNSIRAIQSIKELETDQDDNLDETSIDLILPPEQNTEIDEEIDQGEDSFNSTPNLDEGGN